MLTILLTGTKVKTVKKFMKIFHLFKKGTIFNTYFVPHTKDENTRPIAYTSTICLKSPFYTYPVTF